MQKGPGAGRDRKDIHRRRGSVMELFFAPPVTPPPPLPAAAPEAAPPVPAPDPAPTPAKGSRLKRIKSQIFGSKKEESPPVASNPNEKKSFLRRSLQLFRNDETEEESEKEDVTVELSLKLDKMLGETNLVESLSAPTSPKPKMEGKVGAVQLYYSSPTAKPFDHIAHEKQIRALQAQQEPVKKEKARKEKEVISALVKQPDKKSTPGFQLVKRSDSVCELVPIKSDEGPSSSKPHKPS